MSSRSDRAALLRAVDEARALGDARSVGVAEVQLVWDMIDAGDFREALPYAEDAVARLAETPLERGYCCALLNAGQVHAELGDAEPAIAHYTNAAGLEQLLAHGHSLGDIAVRVGLLHERAGRRDEARAWYQRGLTAARAAPDGGSDDHVPALNLARLAQEDGDDATAAALIMDIPVPVFPAQARGDAGWILTLAGRAAREREDFPMARQRYERALEIYGDAERGLRRVTTETFAAAAAALDGDPAAAIEHHRAALALMDDDAESPPGHRAATMHAIADNLLALGREEEARNMLMQVVAVAAAEGDADRLAKAHGWLAGLARNNGDSSAEQHHNELHVRWRSVHQAQTVLESTPDDGGLWTMVAAVLPDGSWKLVDQGHIADAAPPSRADVERIRRQLHAIGSDRAVVVSAALTAPLGDGVDPRDVHPDEYTRIFMVTVLTAASLHGFTARANRAGSRLQLERWQELRELAGPGPTVIEAVHRALRDEAQPRSRWPFRR